MILFGRFTIAYSYLSFIPRSIQKALKYALKTYFKGELEAMSFAAMSILHTLVNIFLIYFVFEKITIKTRDASA